MICKCTKCQHEWQAATNIGHCDWCGAPGYKLADNYTERNPHWLRKLVSNTDAPIKQQSTDDQ